MNANDIIEKCAEIASKRATSAYDGCERLSSMDHTTGVYECALEVNGGDCLCVERQEEAAAIANEIRSLKSSLPAETVSEATMAAARDAFDAAYTAEYIGGALGCRDNKDIALLAALEAAALAPVDDGWRPTHVHINSGRKERFLRIAKYKAASNEEWVECVVYDNSEGMMFITSVGRWHNTFVALPAPPKDGRE